MAPNFLQKLPQLPIVFLLYFNKRGNIRYDFSPGKLSHEEAS